MANEKLTILFCPMDSAGHLNPLVGFGQLLVPKHRVVFAINNESKGNLIKFGFEEEIYEVANPFEMNNESWETEEEDDKNKSPLESWKDIVESEYFWKMAQVTNPEIKDIVDQVKPDLVVVDSQFILPTAIKNTPWISLVVGNPNLFLFDEKSPPFGFGLPANDTSSWKQLNDQLKEVFAPMTKMFNQWYQDEGLPKNPDGESAIVYHSPYLNIYSYPSELDYTDLRPNPPKWVRVDTFMIKPTEEFQIPDKLKNKQGKLIYFSLGSVNSMDVNLMKKIISYLSDSPHRFIVSKGAFGDEIDLPDNCWGENFVPQTAVLKIVDLAIIHGGNNSLCEAFYYGKPMIVMPIFADQPDNAQRVEEKGFGVRVNPFNCSKEELLNAIEKIANDNELYDKMKLIAERCERESKSNKIVEMIEQVVVNAKK